MNIHQISTIYQKSPSECGAACLGMVLSYYNYYEPIEKLKASCCITKNGSNSKYILLAAEKIYNLETSKFDFSRENLNKLNYPAIIELKDRKFVVLEDSILGKYYINSPARGRAVWSEEKLLENGPLHLLSFKPGKDFQPKGHNPKVLGVLGYYLRYFWKERLLLGWYALLTVLPTAMLTYLLQYFIDEIMVGRMEWFHVVIISFILFGIASVIIGNIYYKFQNVCYFRSYSKVGDEFFRHVLKLPISFFSQVNSADLAFRFLKMESFYSVYHFWHLTFAVKFWIGLVYFVIMLVLNVKLSLIALVISIVPLFINMSLKNRQIFYTNRRVASEQKLEILTNTGIIHVDALKANVWQRDYFDKWAIALSNHVSNSCSEQVASNYPVMIANAFHYFTNMVVFGLGVFEVLHGEMTLGGLFAFSALLKYFAEPFAGLGSILSRFNRLIGISNLCQEVTDEEEDAKFTEGSQLKYTEGKLEIKHLYFGYERFEPPFIKDFNLVLEPGKTVALVGNTGSGKSTLAKLITALLTPTSGEILLDGKSIYDYSQEEFYRAFATVDQRIATFNANLVDNLTLFAPEYDPQILFEALEDAALLDDISYKGSINEIMVSEGGKNFSGGQLQRIEIARAFAKNAPIMVFDEATSALDPVTEETIVKSIKQRGCSCLFIAHRLSTVRDCDEIIMLNKGQVIERGTHRELMELNGAYAALMQKESEKGILDDK